MPYTAARTHTNYAHIFRYLQCLLLPLGLSVLRQRDCYFTYVCVHPLAAALAPHIGVAWRGMPTVAQCTARSPVWYSFCARAVKMRFEYFGFGDVCRLQLLLLHPLARATKNNRPTAERLNDAATFRIRIPQPSMQHVQRFHVCVWLRETKCLHSHHHFIVVALRVRLLLLLDLLVFVFVIAFAFLYSCVRLPSYSCTSSSPPFGISFIYCLL